MTTQVKDIQLALKLPKRLYTYMHLGKILTLKSTMEDCGVKNGEEILDSTEVAEETVENIAKFLMDNRSQQMLLTKSSVA